MKTQEILDFQFLKLNNTELFNIEPSFLTDTLVGYLSCNPDRCGFESVVYSFSSCDYSSDTHWLKSANLKVTLFLEISALYDGIRHLEIGNDGYINYPNLQDILKMMVWVQECELKFCSEVNGRELP